MIIATLLAAVSAFLGFSPDPQVASDLVAYADQAKTAISMRNWIALGSTLVSAGVFVYLWVTGRKTAVAQNSVLLILVVSGGLLFFGAILQTPKIQYAYRVEKIGPAKTDLVDGKPALVRRSTGPVFLC